MKHIFFFIAILALNLPASAGENDAVLQKIETANRNVSTLQAPFVQVKTLASKKTVQMSGTLYYTRMNQMAMLYSQPDGNRFIINNGRMLIASGGQNKTYTLSSTPSMQSLADYLLCALAGKVRDIAQKNNVEMDVQTLPDNYTITLKAKTKQAKGYARITLVYDRKSGLLQRMEMEEFNHTLNVYTISQIKTGSSIPEQTYKI